MKGRLTFEGDPKETEVLVRKRTKSKITEGQILGFLQYNDVWKRWVFCPAGGVITGDIWFDSSCLNEISKKLDELKEVRPNSSKN